MLLTAFFWGGTFVAGRDVALHMAPFTASFLRFLIASALLWVLIKKFEGGLPRLARGQWVSVALLGLIGIFGYNALFFTGLRTVPAGRAAVIVAMNPVLIALGAALFFGERLTRRRVLGVVVSASGAIVAISHGRPWTLFSEGVSWGDAAILGCVVTWATYSLLGRYSMKSMSPHAAVTYSCLVGTALLLPAALAEGLLDRLPGFPLLAWIDVAYLGACGTVLGFTWYYEGVKTLGPGRASVFINFVPLFAILAGYVLLSEPVHPTLLFGAALVCSGAYVTNRG